MHEVSLVFGIRAAVEKAARVYGLSRVFKIKLVVGQDLMVLPEAMAFAFEHLKRAPLTPDAVLEIEVRPGRDLLVENFEGEP